VGDASPFNVSITMTSANASTTLQGVLKVNFGDGSAVASFDIVANSKTINIRFNHTFTTSGTYTVTAKFYSTLEGARVSSSFQVIATVSTFLWPSAIGCFSDEAVNRT